MTKQYKVISNGNKIIIRSVYENDLEEIFEMVCALARHHNDVPTVTIGSLKRDLLDKTPWVHALIAEVNDNISGYALLCPLAQVQFGQRGLDMHHLYVKTDFRRLGVAHCLINSAMDKALDLGCNFVVVGTKPENVIAQKVYSAAGFYRKGPSSSPRFIKRV